MACGGCRKRSKAFSRKVRKAKRGKKPLIRNKKVSPPEVQADPVVEAKPKKKKRGISKRGAWLRKKRKAERRAARIAKKIAKSNVE